MVEAGIRTEIIYTHRKTGLIVTQDNWEKLPESALMEWDAAVHEYFEMLKRKPK